MSDNGTNEFSKGLLLGSLIGGAIGAMAALLLAPKSGKEFRRDLADKSVEYYSKASDAINTVSENYSPVITSAINEGKAKAQSIIDSAKNKANSLISDAEKAIQEAKAKATNTRESIQDKFETVRDATKAGVDAFKSELNS
ncbi:MAG: YtxH domain-containing protein [Candidatus Kapabacteria bacterium]|nr:YtxH domain-containing protein [Candidatus Kapabacteria bacterium]